MFKKLLFFLLGGLVLAQPLSAQSQDSIESDLQYRAAFDLGSGIVKMQAAWVDQRAGRIVEVAEREWVYIPIFAAIRQDPNGAIPEEVVLQLIDSLRAFQQKAGQKGHLDGSLGTASESFRRANNGQQVLSRIDQELGIKVYCLSPNGEAILGHRALQAEDYLKEHIPYILWENGGGSFQISSQSEEGFRFYNRSLGKVAMTTHLLEQVQGKDRQKMPHPNPISREEADQMIAWIQAELQDIPSWLREKIDEANVDVIGFSAMFPAAIQGLGKRTFTKEEVGHLIDARIGQLGEEFSDGHIENQPFVLSDLIFLYGMMDALGMQQVHCPNKKGPGSTSGLLVDEEKWASPLAPTHR